MLDLYRERREMLGKGRIDGARYRALDRDLGDVPLTQIGERLETYVKRLRIAPSEHTGKLLANGTINRLVDLASTAFNLAVGLELLSKSPMTKMRFPKLREIPRDRVLTEAEKIRFMEVLQKEAPHLIPMVRYALQVPCRKSELVNMRREDLDLPNGYIRVRNGTTKNDQGCDKPIPPDMLDYFRSLPPEAEYLFYRTQGKRYLPMGCFSKPWYNCLRLAGISNFRFHDTRHIAATALLDNGTPEQVVLAVAGWKSNMIRTD